MPRPQRDYNVALKQDIEKIDRRIETLLIEREHKVRMLAALNEPIRVDVQSFIAGSAERREKHGKRGGRKRSAK